MPSSEFAPKAIVRALPGSLARSPPLGAFAATTPTSAPLVATRQPFPSRHLAVDPALNVDGSPELQPARSSPATTSVGKARRICARTVPRLQDRAEACRPPGASGFPDTARTSGRRYFCCAENHRTAAPRAASAGGRRYPCGLVGRLGGHLRLPLRIALSGSRLRRRGRPLGDVHVQLRFLRDLGASRQRPAYGLVHPRFDGRLELAARGPAGSPARRH